MADIDKLFEQIENDVLTEDIKLQMAVLFENTLNETIKAKETELEEKFKADFIAEKEELINKLDSYLDHFCTEFVENNKNVIEENVKVKTAEKILALFESIVNDFNLQLNENKIEDGEKLEEAKQEIVKLTNQLIESKKEIKIREKAALVYEASTQLSTDMEKGKLLEYANKLSFDDLFEKKIGAFVKNLITESTQKVEPVKEKIEVKTEEEVVIVEKNESQIDKYLQKL